MPEDYSTCILMYRDLSVVLISRRLLCSILVIAVSASKLNKIKNRSFEEEASLRDSDFFQTNNRSQSCFRYREERMPRRESGPSEGRKPGG